MILTLAWKEVREHRSIWITMVVMTVLLGWGLSHIVAAGDRNVAAAVAALTILGMAATYGVVCGAMMFAGEHEGGTLVFLDIFLGRRPLLWLGKFGLGAALALSQAIAVGGILCFLDQDAPAWGVGLLGRQVGVGLRLHAVGFGDASLWLFILPVVTLEAYVWGLFGSSLSRRVLSAAAVAAVGAAPVWLFAVCMPPQAALVIRLAAGTFVLAYSCVAFVDRAREPGLALEGAPSTPDEREEFLEAYASFEVVDAAPHSLSTPTKPAVVAAPAPSQEAFQVVHEPAAAAKKRPREVPAHSPAEALWWLTGQQALPITVALAVAVPLAAFLMPANSQILWPLFSMLLGILCGTAAFAPEQRDLSYQFLAAQHLPLESIWRFKTLYWGGVAVIGGVTLLVGAYIAQLCLAEILTLRQGQLAGNVAPLFQGTLVSRMGGVLFFTAWLAVGYCAGLVVVWLCRKNILAVLVSVLVASAAMSLWLPSLLAGGTWGWQLWLVPLLAIVASRLLVRAWAGGRIKERRPALALTGFASAVVAWALICYAWRAWELPDVGNPVDAVAYKAELPLGKENLAAKAVLDAVGSLADPDDPWLAHIAEATRLKPGVLEMPRGDGQPPVLQHMLGCRQMADKLLVAAAAKKDAEPALEHLGQLLALSRNLRGKAPLESYLAGIEIEERGIRGIETWLKRGKPEAGPLRRLLDELHRHAEETPPPLDCLRTECYRSFGALDNTNLWAFAAPGSPDRIPERWLAGALALSLDMPWEAERKVRIAQLVWGGLFRWIETPPWELPAPASPPAAKEATRRILRGWLPPSGGRLSAVEMSRLLDPTWLADDRLFPSTIALQSAARRSRWRVDAQRQAVALALYQLEQGQPAGTLADLVPKYLPAQSSAAIDPYSGKAYHYRVGGANEPSGAAQGQGIVWSTGPDRENHGAILDGSVLPDDDARWGRDNYDLITLVPLWR